MTDVALFHTDDGGEVEIENGHVLLDSTPRTAFYLSLFGGNERDDGSAATEHLQWWGNLSEPDADRHLRSETQALLRALPATSGNLPRITDAAKRDLSWIAAHLQTDVSVDVSIPDRNRVAIVVAADVDGETYQERFEARWGADS